MLLPHYFPNWFHFLPEIHYLCATMVYSSEIAWSELVEVCNFFEDLPVGTRWSSDTWTKGVIMSRNQEYRRRFFWLEGASSKNIDFDTSRLCYSLYAPFYLGYYLRNYHFRTWNWNCLCDYVWDVPDFVVETKNAPSAGYLGGMICARLSVLGDV